MRIEELDFELPREAIAQRPADPRDSCRLMHLTAAGTTEHPVFSELPACFGRGDTLVFNDSKVLPARVMGRSPVAGRWSCSFCVPWESRVALAAIVGRPWCGLRVAFARAALVIVGETEHLELVEEMGEGRWLVRRADGGSLVDLMEVSAVCLFRRTSRHTRRNRRCTRLCTPLYRAPPQHRLPVCISPTSCLSAWRQRASNSLGDFACRSGYVPAHQGGHSGAASHPHRVVFGARQGRRDHSDHPRRGGRVIAVGTTVTRVLETLAQAGALEDAGPGTALSGSTAIYITPGYKFWAVDALLTNFHLPRSTVLTLTMAFAGSRG